MFKLTKLSPDQKKKSLEGFTLIEIIVVLIIVGVLAAIALPNLFGNVKRSRAAEAIATMGTYKNIIEGCLMTRNTGPTPDITPCAIDLTPSPQFTYAFVTPPTLPSGDWTIRATMITDNTATLDMSRVTPP